MSQPIAPRLTDNPATEASVEDAVAANMQKARDICTLLYCYVSRRSCNSSHSVSQRYCWFSRSKAASRHSQLIVPYDGFRLQEIVSDDQIQQYYDACNAPAQVTTSEEVSTACKYSAMNSSVEQLKEIKASTEAVCYSMPLKITLEEAIKKAT
eukprot:IDg2564t1